MFGRAARHTNAVFGRLKHFSTKEFRFAEGDHALIQHKSTSAILTKPLLRGETTAVRYGEIKHDDIIGRRIRDIATARSGKDYRLLNPTLDEYIVLTPRLVTPIYPSDANLIVSLLDIHPDAPFEKDGLREPIEVLEAGTGHGALTLYLARALYSGSAASSQTQDLEGAGPRPDNRSAIIHTLDISSKHSQHAQKVVQGFRRGLYAGNVDFHVGSVSDWLKNEQERRFSSESAASDRPFLEHILLDLPKAEDHLEAALAALNVNGTLSIFKPSITQITKFIELIAKANMPLQLETVRELGPTHNGGREWEVRFFRPRAAGRVMNVVKEVSEDTPDSSEGENGHVIPSDDDDDEHRAGQEAATLQDEAMEMICRPKHGHRVTAGGFFAFWRKLRTRKDD